MSDAGDLKGPTVFDSASVDIGVLVSGFDAPFHADLTKPTDLDALQEVLEGAPLAS